jgi:hypothetical protein
MLKVVLVGMLASMALWGQSAPVCDPKTIEGVWGFQLSGSTTISGAPKPVASVGRLVLDSSGGVTGYASVNFAGYLLGNPVTGTYEARSDCSMVWSLQDDSGSLQNFAGTISLDNSRVTFRQTDQGGAGRGTLMKSAPSCSAATLPKSYRFTVSGTTTPMEPGQTEHRVSADGTIDLGAGDKLAMTMRGTPPQPGKFTVDTECFVQFELPIPGDTFPVKIRGMIVNGGLEILGLETDAGTTVTAHFTAVNR